MTLIKLNRPNNGAGKNEFFPTFSAFPGLLEDFIGNEGLFKKEFANYVPAVNIAESPDHFFIELSAPGFTKEEFKIEVENNTLTVSGEHGNERTEEGKTYTRKEFSFGSFRRAFTLPQAADTDKIAAAYENGILKIAIDKKDEAKAKPAREIKIS